MVTALIFAGGIGARMNSTVIPKQFLKLYGKSILMYTIQNFEKHNEIDNIVIVCLESYMHQLQQEIEYFKIKKVSKIVPGGGTAQESIYNGLKSMKDRVSNDEIVLIHDGVRPCIEQRIISNNIKVVREKGNAITVDYAIETISTINNDDTISNIIDRNSIRIAKGPQSFYYKEILKMYETSKEEGFTSIDSAQIMNYYGVELNTVLTSAYNIKITTDVDYYIFKALLQMKNSKEEIGL